MPYKKIRGMSPIPALTGLELIELDNLTDADLNVNVNLLSAFAVTTKQFAALSTTDKTVQGAINEIYGMVGSSNLWQKTSIPLFYDVVTPKTATDRIQVPTITGGGTYGALFYSDLDGHKTLTTSANLLWSGSGLLVSSSNPYLLVRQNVLTDPASGLCLSAFGDTLGTIYFNNAVGASTFDLDATPKDDTFTSTIRFGYNTTASTKDFKFYGTISGIKSIVNAGDNADMVYIYNDNALPLNTDLTGTKTTLNFYQRVSAGTFELLGKLVWQCEGMWKTNKFTQNSGLTAYISHEGDVLPGFKVDYLQKFHTYNSVDNAVGGYHCGTVNTLGTWRATKTGLAGVTTYALSYNDGSGDGTIYFDKFTIDYTGVSNLFNLLTVTSIAAVNSPTILVQNTANRAMLTIRGNSLLDGVNKICGGINFVDIDTTHGFGGACFVLWKSGLATQPLAFWNGSGEHLHLDKTGRLALLSNGIYLGDPDTDNTWTMVRSSSSLIAQFRASGSYTDAIKITPKMSSLSFGYFEMLAQNWSYIHSDATIPDPAPGYTSSYVTASGDFRIIGNVGGVKHDRLISSF